MIWVVTANTNQCNIYTYEKAKLSLAHQISHPENKLKSSELGTDRPGHYHKNATMRGAYSPDHALHEIKIDNFAREIAEKLDAWRNKNQFSSLIFVMPAQIEGEVLTHLNKQVSALIQHTLLKNLMHLSSDELADYLHNHLS